MMPRRPLQRVRRKPSIKDLIMRKVPIPHPLTKAKKRVRRASSN